MFTPPKKDGQPFLPMPKSGRMRRGAQKATPTGVRVENRFSAAERVCPDILFGRSRRKETLTFFNYETHQGTIFPQVPRFRSVGVRNLECATRDLPQCCLTWPAVLRDFRAFWSEAFHLVSACFTLFHLRGKKLKGLVERGISSSPLEIKSQSGAFGWVCRLVSDKFGSNGKRDVSVAAPSVSLGAFWLFAVRRDAERGTPEACAPQSTIAVSFPSRPTNRYFLPSHTKINTNCLQSTRNHQPSTIPVQPIFPNFTSPIMEIPKITIATWLGFVRFLSPSRGFRPGWSRCKENGLKCPALWERGRP